MLGSLTLTGCGTKQQSETGASPKDVSSFQNIPIETLLASPDVYVERRVAVEGEVYTIGDAVGGSVIVRISPPDQTSVQLLKCEFLPNALSRSTLEKGQFVTIIGTVDIVEGVVFLRECNLMPLPL